MLLNEVFNSYQILYEWTPCSNNVTVRYTIGWALPISQTICVVLTCVNSDKEKKAELGRKVCTDTDKGYILTAQINIY